MWCLGKLITVDRVIRVKVGPNPRKRLFSGNTNLSHNRIGEESEKLILLILSKFIILDMIQSLSDGAVQI